MLSALPSDVALMGHLMLICILGLFGILTANPNEAPRLRFAYGILLCVIAITVTLRLLFAGVA